MSAALATTATGATAQDSHVIFPLMTIRELLQEALKQYEYDPEVGDVMSPSYGRAPYYDSHPPRGELGASMWLKQSCCAMVSIPGVPPLPSTLQVEFRLYHDTDLGPDRGQLKLGDNKLFLSKNHLQQLIQSQRDSTLDSHAIVRSSRPISPADGSAHFAKPTITFHFDHNHDDEILPRVRNDQEKEVSFSPTAHIDLITEHRCEDHWGAPAESQCEQCKWAPTLVEETLGGEDQSLIQSYVELSERARAAQATGDVDSLAACSEDSRVLLNRDCFVAPINA